jgi:hypothetical protein
MSETAKNVRFLSWFNTFQATRRDIWFKNCWPLQT